MDYLAYSKRSNQIQRITSFSFYMVFLRNKIYFRLNNLFRFLIKLLLAQFETKHYKKSF